MFYFRLEPRSQTVFAPRHTHLFPPNSLAFFSMKPLKLVNHIISPPPPPSANDAPLSPLSSPTICVAPPMVPGCPEEWEQCGGTTKAGRL